MMNTVCVVAFNAEHAAMAQLLPPTDLRAEGSGRIYFFYEFAGAGVDIAHRDLDGEMLIETRQFKTLAEAQSWAEADAMAAR
ncbi:MAG: hypothetical protein ABI665_00180 [Vicinamibacterales bacterium]